MTTTNGNLPNSQHRASQTGRSRREGKVLVLLVVALPTLIGLVGLVIDGGLIMDEFRGLQHAVDAAATAAATDIRLGHSSETVMATASDVIKSGYGYADATVLVHMPPVSGHFAGQDSHVAVIAERSYRSRFMHVLDGFVRRSMRARAVAGVRDATVPAAIVVLDRDPLETTIPDTDTILGVIDRNELVAEALTQSGWQNTVSSVPIVGPIAANLLGSSLADLLPDVVANLLDSATSQVSLPALPTLTAGMEVEGLGRLIVDGAVHVNCEWGGEDENGTTAGQAAGPPYGLACMPILPTTRVRARDIRVAGGVDDHRNYQPFGADDTNPLQANRLAVPDPLQDLPVPSAAIDPANVDITADPARHLVRVALSPVDVGQLLASVTNLIPGPLRPLFQPLVATLTNLFTQPTLQPGVYDSITVLSPVGGVRFEPGVYIIRGMSPITQVSLCIIGPVEADGVMFYITNSAAFDASTGTPDASDDVDMPPPNSALSLTPSTLLVPLLPSAHLSGLRDAGSPFDGMLIYQRRLDRRPIVIEAQQLLGGGSISGTIYAKWAHVAFAGGLGTYDLRFVAGTMRFVTLFDTTIAPSQPLPAAKDVYLLE